MLRNLKKVTLLLLLLFFLYPSVAAEAEEYTINGAVVYEYKTTEAAKVFSYETTQTAAIIYPENATSIDTIYLFFNASASNNCINCHVVSPKEACNKFQFCQKVATLKNTAILFFQPGRISGNRPSSYTKANFDAYIAQALAELHSTIPNSPDTISVIAAQGAGTGVMVRYLDFFSADQALIFNGCSDTWCNKIILSNKIDKKNIYLSGETDKYQQLKQFATDQHATANIVKVAGDEDEAPSKCFMDHILHDTCVESKARITAVESVINELTANKPTFEIKIPGLNLSDVTSKNEGNHTYLFLPWIAEFISAIYKLSIALVSIVSVIVIILQGMRIITSGGGEGVSEGYKKISHAVIGLLLAWGSFLILYTINPALVQFNALKVEVIQRQELPVSPSYEDEVDGSAITTSSTVPYFGQYDKRWAKLKPGDTAWPFDTNKCTPPASDKNPASTIQERGCGPTSLAMVLKYLGKDVDPVITSRFASACRGAMQIKNVKDGWATSPWSDLKLETYVNKDKALDLAAQGNPIIFNCHPCIGYTGDQQLKTYPGHYMVITGSPDGGQHFTINDPGGNVQINRAIVTMTRDQILNPQMEQAQQGCQFYSYSNQSRVASCINGLDTVRNPSFVYIHK